MAALTVDASLAADPGLRGPVPARTTGPAAADRSPAAVRPGRTVRSWPLLVLAAPAAAEVWSGWVGIAQKTGFGLVSPLPGIWPSLHLDTAITLPVGVEAYAAYALRAWLARDQIDQRPDPPVRQVVGDLLVRAGHGRAGRLPPDGPGRDGPGAVAGHHDRVLPAGPGPGHGDRAGPHAACRRRGRSRPARTAGPRTGDACGPLPGPARTGPGPGRDTRSRWPGPVLPAGPERPRSRTTTRPRDRGTGPQPARPQMDQARMVARRLAAAGKPVSRRALRSERSHRLQPGPERPGTHDQCRARRCDSVGDDLTGWEVSAAALEVQPEPTLTVEPLLVSGPGSTARPSRPSSTPIGRESGRS